MYDYDRNTVDPAWLVAHGDYNAETGKAVACSALVYPNDMPDDVTKDDFDVLIIKADPGTPLDGRALLILGYNAGIIGAQIFDEDQIIIDPRLNDPDRILTMNDFWESRNRTNITVRMAVPDDRVKSILNQTLDILKQTAADKIMKRED